MLDTRQFVKTPASYLELLRSRALPGTSRGVAAITLALSPPLLCAWFATVHDRWDLFERSGSLTAAIGLLLASRKYLRHGVIELATLRPNAEPASNIDELLEDIHTAKLGLALSAFGTVIWGWGTYLGWWGFSLLAVWAAMVALDAWRDFVHLRDVPITDPPAEESSNTVGPSS
jgi:hypothetical protein